MKYVKISHSIKKKSLKKPNQTHNSETKIS